MIDPLDSLAFSVQANRGVYAVLLGSGVSRSAKIPTGWEITLDLIRKLSAVAGEDCGNDPEKWYRDRYKKDPDYSNLLDELAKTQTERQQLLRAYFEPTEEERAEGIKAPTAAHRAIASLAAKGYIRVIITTNFDRLMERALTDVGVEPTLLSSLDQLEGAIPLIHTPCCVFKVHGDYLDSRIRNTPAELDTYPKEFDDLLDRIFDEFGLIVCGWSAQWDTALRAAIERAKSRRFSHFWAVRGEPGDHAKRLIQHRGAQRLSIADADGFFTELKERVEALERFSSPHPLSTAVAVMRLKSYLAEYTHRIRLKDLVDAEVGRVLDATSSSVFAVQGGPQPAANTFTARVRAYEAACVTLVEMAVVGGYWVEDWHYAIWQRTLTRLATKREHSGYIVWRELQSYPATLLLYALGLGAIEAGERGLPFLGQLFGTPIHQEHQEDTIAVDLLPPFCLFQRDPAIPRLLEGMESRRAPLNDWLHKLLQPRFSRLLSLEHSRFTYAFDRLEVLLALSHAYRCRLSEDEFWGPPGSYGYRRDNCDRIVREIRAALDSQGDRSPYVTSNIFGSSAEECVAGLSGFEKWARKLHRQWW